MESVQSAEKSIFLSARKWSLRMLRNALDRADEWVHEQEVAMRQEAGKQEILAEVDPAASAAREREWEELGARSGYVPIGAGGDGIQSRPPRLVVFDDCKTPGKTTQLRLLSKLPACPPLDATASHRDRSTGAGPRLSAVRTGPRRQMPRLKYQHGEFLRTEARQ
jgi:hypothetical protein